MRIVDLACRPDARHRIIIALIASAAVFLAARGNLRPPTAAIASWNAFAFCILALDWLVILVTPQRKCGPSRRNKT
jgi:hypothetical protein